MIKLRDILTEATQPQFEAVKLGFKFDAYEPHFDEETMRTHYNKHYKGYIEKLNKAIKDEHIPIVIDGTELDIKPILSSVSQYSTAVRNNAGGYYNHNLFFNNLNPEHKGKIVDGELKTLIETQFKSMDKFQTAFTQAALDQFGSGWVWLMYDNGRLSIATTSNQDNPYMDVVRIPGEIIIALDVWEHSYYLKYKNDRERYVNAFFKLVCYHSAEERLNRSINKSTY